MNYKIEKRPNTYHVILSHGEYSDYSETHLFFAANSPEESWYMLCEYQNNIVKESDYFSPDGALQWNDRMFITDAKKHQLATENDEMSWVGYQHENVEIKMLEIIVFSKL